MAARTGDPNKAASPNATATSQSAPVVAPTPAPAVTTNDDIPFKSNEEVANEAAPVTAEADTGQADNILAMIRARQGQ